MAQRHHNGTHLALRHLMKNIWIPFGSTMRRLVPYAAFSSLVLGSPALGMAESPARDFGFFSVFGSNNHNEEIRDVAFSAQYYENSICAVGQVSSTATTTDQTTVNPGSGGTAGAMDVWLGCWDTGGRLSFATVFGGPGYDTGYAITTDTSGIYIAGRAGPGLATTPGGLQPNFAGDTAASSEFGPQDGFIAKYNWGGERVWLSYLGDASSSYVNDLAVDPTGAVYAVLTEVTADNPHITAGAFSTVRPGGGDAVVAKLQSTGQLIWATYLGGSGADLHAPALAVDERTHTVFVVGSGNSTNFPVTPNADQSAYGGGSSDLTLTALNQTGNALAFSTYFGGSAADVSNGNNLVVDSDSNTVVISGDTNSPNIATSSAAAQVALAGGTDMVLAAFTLGGSRTATTYLGGSAADHNGGLALYNRTLVIAGSTESTDLPMQHNDWRGAGLDGYVALTNSELKQISSANRIGGSDADAFLAVAASYEGYAAVGWSASTELRTPSAEAPEQSMGENRRDAWIVLNKYIPDAPVVGACDASLGCKDLGNCAPSDPLPTGCVGCTGSGRPNAGSLLLFVCTAGLVCRSRRRRSATALPS